MDGVGGELRRNAIGMMHFCLMTLAISPDNRLSGFNVPLIPNLLNRLTSLRNAPTMSTENVTALAKRISQDPSLQTKVAEICKNTPTEAAQEVSRLSHDLGIPVTAEEILEVGQQPSGSLPDSALEAFSGGIEFSWSWLIPPMQDNRH